MIHNGKAKISVCIWLPVIVRTGRNVRFTFEYIVTYNVRKTDGVRTMS